MPETCIEKEFFKLSIKRTVAGLEITFYCPEIHAFLRSIYRTVERSSNTGWATGRMYLRPEDRSEEICPGVYFYKFYPDEVFKLLLDGKPNLSFLRVLPLPGMETVTLIMTNCLPTSKENIDVFITKTKEAISYLYKNFIKKCSVELAITTKEII